MRKIKIDSKTAAKSHEEVRKSSQRSRRQEWPCSYASQHQQSPFFLISLLLILLFTSIQAHQTPEHDAKLIPEEVANNNNDRRAQRREARKRANEKNQKEQANLFESLWNRLVHHDDQREINKEEEDLQAAAQQHSPRHRRVTRRRALYEHALNSHYLPQKEEHDDDDSHHVYSSSESSWMDHDQLCVYYNENKRSHWTYQWCPPRVLSEEGGTLMQQHWKPRVLPQTSEVGQQQQQVEWRVASQHSLGEYVAEPSPEEKQHWRVTLGWDVSNHNKQTVEYYTHGQMCSPSRGSKQGRQRRRSLVVVNPQVCLHQRESQTDKWRILNVMEPQPCHYILYVCLNTGEGSEESASAHESAEEESLDDVISDDGTRNDELAREALRAFLHQSGVDQAQVDKSDRSTSLHIALPPFPPSRSRSNRELIRNMFEHAYDSYMYHAFPASELQPITCTPGTFDLVRLPALTLVDTLDTFIVMGNTTEFARSVERLRLLHESMEGGLFGVPQNVSVFETNIRVLGGLLSAHQLAEAFLEPQSVAKSDVFNRKGRIRIGTDIIEQAAVSFESDKSVCESYDDDLQLKESDRSCGESAATKGGPSSKGARESKENRKASKTNTTASANMKVEFWTYDGILLDLAHDLGRRLLPAFDSKTGIPYGTVNLMTGIPRGETTVASLAGGGTLTLEMELLSHLTGDETFGNAAKLASRALWMRRSPTNQLLGKHIEIEKGLWTESLSGIGSNSDSFYEYLIKHYIMFAEDDDFWQMFVSTYSGVHNGSRLGEWYVDTDMSLGIQQGGGGRRVFESLMAFYPGMQVLLGELAPASRTLNSFLIVRELLGVLPERFNYGNWKVDGGAGGAGKHPLRPELLESCYFMHRASRGLAGQRPFGNVSSPSSTSGWLWAADYALHTLERLTDTKRCGYATVDNTGPSTSGVLPERNEKTNWKVQLANEMPSIFLSETLKYLYLSFDDENILHKDDEREWIFTTEAHPIHSVPYDGQRKEESELEALKTRTEELLLRRLAQKSIHGKSRPVVRDERSSALSLEKWTMSSQMPLYVSGIRDIETDILVRKQSQLAGQNETSALADILHSYAAPLEPSSVAEHNVAYLSIGDRGLGDGSMLKKSCPNFHSSSLDWVRALNGGVLDYADVYVSSISDEAVPASLVLSTAEALAYHGSGLYPGMDLADERNSCPISNTTWPTLESQDEIDTSASVEPPTEGVERIDMGGDLGMFDVSVFHDGIGFYVQHVESGETVMATILEEEKPPSQDSSGSTKGRPFNPYVMVYAKGAEIRSRRQPESEEADQEKSNDPHRASGTSWKYISRRIEDRAPETEEAEASMRSIGFTDTQNGPFRCEVQIVEQSPLNDEAVESCKGQEDQDCSDVEKELVLATIPCSPALFGPSLLSNLAETGGVIVEGTVAPPRSDLGCNSPCDKPSAAYAAPADISLVWRGKCTFESKALNQQACCGSQAVIIVNNADEELFLMSGGLTSDEKACFDSDTEAPLTVLVTGQDGKKIASLLEDARGSSSKGGIISLIGRVQILPSRGYLTDDAKVRSDTGPNDVDWPVIKAAPDIIQILAEGGWGVHAMNRASLVTSSGSKTTREWQLFMLRHEKHANEEKSGNANKNNNKN